MNSSNSVNMSTCKVVAPSSREALRMVRERLGPDAIVLSNRVTANGVEIVATMEEALSAMTSAATPVATPPSTFGLAPGSAVFSDQDSVLREIHSMRGMIEEQLAGLSWNERQRRDPVRGHLLRTLLGAGFSARLAKDVLENLTTGQSYANGMDYVKSELARQMPVIENENTLMAEGGVYALMGPTGVGKTTTTAKLAARCVMRFGAEKLALVTTDSYRIGAYEQLRIYGQILGVSVHAVKDAADLDRVLGDLGDKHMVLIDTVGMSQRDRAVSDQIAMLCDASRPVKRLLLLNASSHGDTLNEVVQAYRHTGQRAGSSDLAGCIFTKVDEATHPGVLVDMAIRHQLPVHYISNGQKVPEHLVLANRGVLIDRVFQAKSQSSLFVPGEADLENQSAPLNAGAQLAAAEAVSERLRLQCQQLISVLTHNTQELASYARSLASGQIGFEETRSLWRTLSDNRVDGKAIAQTLISQVVTDINTGCSDCVLALAGEIHLASDDDADSCAIASTLLLSDRSGLPFSAPHQVLSGSARPKPGWMQQHKFNKPIVHLLGHVPTPELVQEWQSSGFQWAACCTAGLCIVDVQSGTPGTLAKLAAGLSYSTAQPVMHRRKHALVSFAEAPVMLHREATASAVDAEASPVPLRCVVRRIVDAESGRPLAHSYMLASTSVQATAQQITLWATWRTVAEPYFELFKQCILQLGGGGGGVAGNAAFRKRLLIAGQVSTTVFRLQRAQDGWADQARMALAHLAGRPVRAGRPVPGPALMEGMGKLFVLLDALEPNAAAVMPQPHVTPAQS